MFHVIFIQPTDNEHFFPDSKACGYIQIRHPQNEIRIRIVKCFLFFFLPKAVNTKVWNIETIVNLCLLQIPLLKIQLKGPLRPQQQTQPYIRQTTVSIICQHVSGFLTCVLTNS